MRGQSSNLSSSPLSIPLSWARGRQSSSFLCSLPAASGIAVQRKNWHKAGVGRNHAVESGDLARQAGSPQVASHQGEIARADCDL
jgi:hypothetical protein